MATSAQLFTVKAPSPVTYTQEEWKQNRGIITELWSSGISQKEVLRVLAQDHDFRPSQTMLKKRIRKWDLQRNHKESDMVAALRIALQREAQGKRSEFVIRGHIVTLGEIKRYLKRKGIRDVHEFAASSAGRSSAPPMTAYTPPPSPPTSDPSESDSADFAGTIAHFQEDDRSDRNQDEIDLLSSDTRLIVRPDADHIYPTLPGPPDLELLMQALLSNAAYYDLIFVDLTSGASNTPMQAFPAEFPEGKGLRSFTNGMWKGRDLLLEGQVHTAFQCFDQAFSSIRDILTDHSRKFLPELYEMLLNFQVGAQASVLDALLRFVLKMSQIHPQKSHLITTVAASLLQIPACDRSAAVDCLLTSVSHRFYADLGPAHPETLSIRKALSRSTFRRRQLSEAAAYLMSLLHADHAIDPYETCGILIELAQCCRFQAHLDDAVEWIRRAWNAAEHVVSRFHQADVRVRCLRILSWVEQKRGSWRSAQVFARAAVEISATVLGPEDSLTPLVEDELWELEAAFAGLSAGVADG